MLTVFRSVLPSGSEPTGAPSAVNVGTEGELPCLVAGLCGNADEETARLATAGLGSSEVDGARWATPMLECRVFATGSEGRGPVGGAIEGRDGRGSVFVPDMVNRQECLHWCSGGYQVLGMRFQSSSQAIPGGRYTPRFMSVARLGRGRQIFYGA